jgi:hypothetical protein
VRLAALARLALACVLVAALTACESNQERSAKIEKADHRQELETERHIELAERALTITHPSTKVKVLATGLLKGAEGMAAVVTLRNLSGTALRDVPIEVTVENAQGAKLYSNDVAGLGAGLNSDPLLGAHATATWIDDQVQAAGTAASVSAKVGEGTPVAGAVPSLSVTGARQYEDPTNGPAAEGSVVNHSHVSQQELIVFATVRRGGRIVAAGRALLPSAPAGSSTRFQLFFIGKPGGGSLEVSVPPTTFG